MQYKYYPLEAKPFGSNKKRLLWRPIIEVILISNNKLVSHPILLDTGADVSLFKANVADLLGIKPTSGKRKKVRGIGNTEISGFEHPFNIRVPGLKIVKTKAVFTNDLPKYSVSIAGNLGFFDKFKVTFDSKNKTIGVS
jgi:hypothetical protein